MSRDSTGMPEQDRTGERRELHVGIVFGLLLLALLPRLLYSAAQPSADPTFEHPALDGGYYLDWARQLAAGQGGPPGAYYLAPLFPHAVALLFRLVGENLPLLYLCQQLLAFATAWVIARGCRGLIGARAAAFSAVLFLLHHPLVFFASRPLGETLALFFLFAAIAVMPRESRRAVLSAGLLAGLAALARPNLLLVPLFWAVGEMLAARYRRALLVAAGLALVLTPVALRNFAVSGHPVPISSNSGITAYHGNGPGARGGFTATVGFSGEVSKQREEATTLARLRSGIDLDPVEADRWWGRQAAIARLGEPLDTVKLISRRLLLLADNYEYGLSAHPSLDANPWRPTWHAPRGRELAWVPFAALLGLAASALLLGGARRSGGWWTWSAILACALTPVLFYMSSRYRLPAAALLVIPAGRGIAGLLGQGGQDMAVRFRAAVVGAAVLAVSLTVSSVDLFGLESIRRVAQAEGLASRAAAYKRAGDLESAERDARQAVSMAPNSAPSAYNLGVIVEARGRTRAAERHYRDALTLSGYGQAEAAANLARILIDRGEANAAIPVLTRALELRPAESTCWNNLVVALMITGQGADAIEAIRQAADLGVNIDPGLIAIVQGSPGSNPPSTPTDPEDP